PTNWPILKGLLLIAQINFQRTTGAKHPKSYSKPDPLYFPFRGQKNPSAEHRFLLGVSDSSLRARNLSTSHQLSTGFSANPMHRAGQTNLSVSKHHARVFFNYSLMPQNNHQIAEKPMK
ncbi:MAG TPA: hypothetical protein VK840_05475, partial [Candidatus Dormibacteraeota bacterium]|nr:hypothetical protein [Candidatus Dormibacteraeota bacterium]